METKYYSWQINTLLWYSSNSCTPIFLFFQRKIDMSRSNYKNIHHHTTIENLHLLLKEKNTCPCSPPSYGHCLLTERAPKMSYELQSAKSALPRKHMHNTHDCSLRTASIFLPAIPAMYFSIPNNRMSIT